MKLFIEACANALRDYPDGVNTGYISDYQTEATLPVYIKGEYTHGIATYIGKLFVFGDWYVALAKRKGTGKITD